MCKDISFVSPPHSLPELPPNQAATLDTMGLSSALADLTKPIDLSGNSLINKSQTVHMGSELQPPQQSHQSRYSCCSDGIGTGGPMDLSLSSMLDLTGREIMSSPFSPPSTMRFVSHDRYNSLLKYVTKNTREMVHLKTKS